MQLEPSNIDAELWEYLRSNSFLSESYKIFYVATPKVACTSLKWWFAYLSGLSESDFRTIDSQESDPELIIHDTFCKLAPHTTGLKPQDLMEPLKSNLYFRFAMVRNPYTRIFSAWQSKLLIREPLQSDSFVNCDFFNYPIDSINDVALAFEGFLEHLLTLEDKHFDAHWKPQFNVIRPDLIPYSRITKLENFDDLLRDLTSLGKPIPQPLSSTSKNESLLPYSSQFITARSSEIIQQLYSQDFEVFEYEKEISAGRKDFSSAEMNIAARAIKLIRGRNIRLGQLRVLREREANEYATITVKLKNELKNTQENLRQSQSELNELRNSLAAIYSSRCWKVTHPLRTAHRVLLKSKRLIDRFHEAATAIVNSLHRNGVLETVKKIIKKLKLHSSRYSALNRACKPLTHINNKVDQSTKKLTLVSMIKNEKNIIETFASHALAMFDRVIFVDHRSTDGTGEYLRSLSESFPEVEYFLFDEAGYYQSEVMTWVVKNIVGREDGWVFFLDADEFLPFTSRVEFNEALKKYNSFPIISMPWLNLVPVNMETDKINNETFLRPAKTAIHHKIAFQPCLIPLEEYIVAQGNHALMVGEALDQTFPAENAFPIYHLPIRTEKQLRDKIQHGVEAYKKMGEDRGKNLGFHWDEIGRLIEQKGLAEELMADIVARYGEPLTPPFGKTKNEMIQEGYCEFILNLSLDEKIPHFDEDMYKKSDEVQPLDSFKYGNLQSKRGLSIKHDTSQHVLSFAPSDNN